MTTKTATTSSIYKSGQSYHVPPGQLVLERNIREAKPDAELLASVKTLGVLQPITAVIGNDGRLIVRLGHRRTLAALETKRPTVPVYVVDVDDTTDAGEISRVIAQHDENTQRAGLTAGDELHVVEQLAAFGLTADQMVDQARLGKDQVDTALRVSASKVAAKAAAKYSDVTLEQMATVAEFEDDDETVKALVVAAVQEPETFEHLAQRARDDRIRNARRDQLLAELETAGVKVIEQPDHGPEVTPMHRLRTEAGKEVKEAAHAKCPGLVAWFRDVFEWVDPDGNPAEADTPGRRNLQMPTITYGCKNARKHGHVDSWYSSSGGGKPAAADMSDKEREKASKQRRLVIDNNQAWDAATVVRRQWLKTLASNRSAPKGSAAFLATALVSDQGVITHYKAADTTREVFGIKNTGYRSIEAHILKELKNATEGRALVLALLPVLGAYESMADRSAWRQDGTQSHAGRYLRFLESAGYPLSDVEKFAISSKRVS
ncbi:hypothetical protein GCM10009795_040220 [Nocardioides hankookensis]|uniref:ParB N-terminal domain-containing protein n=1 Tax=Nocardioides hankookensis TaxID=443157 RepID=A0ABW1LR14_9ACTN